MPRKGQKRPLADRFWPKVDRRGDDECWPWLGAICKGYGQIWDGEKVIGAHRASLIVAGVPLRDDQDALHQPWCGNKSCVNPAHLRSGTHQENMADAIEAGTFRFNPSPKGDRSYNHVLTEKDVVAIRRQCMKQSQRDLADDYGVSSSTIRKVITRATWGHVL